MDIASFLGGLALGAAGAALFEEGRRRSLLGDPAVLLMPDEEERRRREREKDPLGVTAGGAAPSGGGAHALGPVVGPPSMGPSGGGGPRVLGPRVSVEPIVHGTSGEVILDGGLFFGLSSPVWFWPWWAPYYGQVPLVCRKRTTEAGEEIWVCERERPAFGYPVAWGAPYGW